LATDQSFGRNTDGNSLLVSFAQSTPGVTNSGGIPLVAKPVFNPVSGVYSSNQTITISSATPGANIYYTTDGSEPNQNSTYYNGPFSVGSSVSIRAIALKSGYTNSEISTASYIYYNTDLPIISISTKPANLWNNNSGIYVVGTNGANGNCMPGPANFNQNWERPANITMIETDGSLAFNTNAGISISGGCSRRNPQKSLNVAAKSIYGSSNFKHQIFPEYDQKKYKRFKLRNGGNDFNGFALRDVISQSVVEDEIDLDQQRSRACVVFINGDYWGIMNIRDSYSEHWIKENHKIADKDSIDLLEPSGSGTSARIIEGNNTDYINLYNYISSNNLSNQSNYNYVQSKIDINEYINYWITQLYLANTDWPGNNVKIWKEQLPDAKFRWLLFDADWTLGYTRGWSNQTTQADHTKNMLNFATNTANSGWPNDQASTLIFRKLLQNTTFKNEFIQRAATQMEILFDPIRCQSIADMRYNEIINEKQAHFNRWINETEDGTGNSMNELNMTYWQSEYDYVRNWFTERRPYMENHIKSYFNIGGTYTLNIPVNANTNGSVLLNENEYKAPYNYAGKYFDNIPMRIRAVPAPNYRFSHWQENNSADEVQIFTSSGGRTRTPIFVPAKELVINEIFYNPTGTSESTEFIEIYNPDNQTKSLEGCYFDDGICFEFPQGASIAAGEFIVLAKYASVYSGNGYQVFQWDDSSLNNDGELLVFMNPAKEVLDSVRYNDNIDWPQEADGDGYSLALLQDDLDNGLSTAWQRQDTANPITPGAENKFCNPITVNPTIADATCAGSSDGFISISVSGGTAPYTYLWNNGQTSNSIIDLSAGNYTLTISDALSCKHNETIILSEPAPLLANVNAINETYFQANDGSVVSNPTGGTSPYSFSWSNGSNSSNQNNLAPGIYTLTLTDAAYCTTTKSVEILPIDCSNINLSISSTDETYFQNNDGTAEANVNVGISPYTYSWSNGTNTAFIDNLAPGTYTVEVIDAVGCMQTKSVTINGITCGNFDISVTATDETYFQNNNGTAEVAASSGILPYTYSWSNGANTAVVDNLAPGNYIVEVTDAVGCSLSETLNINAITCNTLQATIVSTNETSFQANNGTANVNVSGGAAPYTYNWSNGATLVFINNLPAGNYSVQITDAVGCTLNKTTTINSVDCSALSLDVVSSNQSYYQINDGTAEAVFTGGTAPLEYSWSNGDDANTSNNLAPGNYSLTAVDSKGCSLTKSFTINAVDCSSVELNINKTDETYFQNNDGTATAIVNGGITPYAYNWSNGASTSSINNLSPGNYSLAVSDAIGCPVNQTININAITCTSLSIQVNKTDETYYQANDGTAQVVVNGGISPYSYNWSNGLNTNAIDMLSPSTYSLEVKDAVGCVTMENITIDALTCAAIEVEVNQQPESCYGQNDGSVNITNISNGTSPYSINWSNGSSATTVNNLTQGTYALNITDVNGCPFAQNYSIAGPTEITTVLNVTPASDYNQYDGSVNLTVQGGAPPYLFYWSNGATTEDVNNLLSANYWVSITDANNCSILVSNITIDAGSCMPTFSQMDKPIINSGTTQVVDYIISNGSLMNGSTVSFKAGNYIQLLNDFEVNVGAEFEAAIEDCQ